MDAIKISSESLSRFQREKNVITSGVVKHKRVRKLKRDEFFKLSENGRVYVRGYYERIDRKYECYLYDDVCHEIFLSGDREVIVDFDF